MRQPFKKELPRNLKVYQTGQGQYRIDASYCTPPGRDNSKSYSRLVGFACFIFIPWVFHHLGGQIGAWVLSIGIIVLHYRLRTEGCIRRRSEHLKLSVGPKGMRWGGLRFGSLVSKGEEFALRVEPDQAETLRFHQQDEKHLQVARVVLLKGARQMTRIVLYTVAEAEALYACDQIIAVIHRVCDMAGLGEDPKPTRRLRER